MELIKVKAGVATREPLPDFLVGLAPESLADLSWTDPVLGVQDCAWWPLEDHSPALGEWQAYGDELITLDQARKVAVRLCAIVPAPPTEVQFLAAVDGMLAEGAARKGYDSIYTASIRAGYAGPFHDEGVSYASWMDSVYSTCYSLLAQVEAGTHPYPETTAALLALLPQCPFAANPPGG